MADKKRKLPPILRAWHVCREKEGVQPFTKMSRSERERVEACVMEKVGKKKKR